MTSDEENRISVNETHRSHNLIRIAKLSPSSIRDLADEVPEPGGESATLRGDKVKLKAKRGREMENLQRYRAWGNR